MKFNRVLSALVALIGLVGFTITASAQQSVVYNAQAGVSFITGVSATATQSSGAVRLPGFSGTGFLNVSETGITGSPSGCTLALSYQANNGTNTLSATSISFTPATGLQQLAVSPANATGDQYVLTYACSSAYPTAGLISVSFSPVDAASADPCITALKTSAAISIAAASTAQIVPLAAGKKIYVCGVTDASAGTTPSIQLEYGTGTNCASVGATLTGVIPFTSGSAISIGDGAGTTAVTAAGSELCAITVGTGHGGIVTYVQQ